jgi:hypothetical protein
MILGFLVNENIEATFRLTISVGYSIDLAKIKFFTKLIGA